MITDSGFSEYLSINRGVPQGSVIGPLLFNLYVAHLPDIAKANAATLLMFADDKTLYTAQRNRTIAAAVATDALEALSAALLVLGLSINTTKTKTMFISPSRRTHCGDDQIMYRGLPLDVVSHIKCLGVIVDESLSWKHHIDAVVAKVSREIGALRRVRRQLSAQVRRQFLLSVVEPDLLYCIEAFLLSLPVKERQRLLAIHRRALRATIGADYHSDCDQITQELCVIPLLIRWLVMLCRLTYECHRQPASSALSTLMTPLQSAYPTRGATRQVAVISLVSKKAGTSSLAYRLPLIWNLLPNEAKDSHSIVEFVGHIVSFLHDPTCLSRLTSMVFDNVYSL